MPAIIGFAFSPLSFLCPEDRVLPPPRSRALYELPKAASFLALPYYLSFLINMTVVSHFGFDLCKTDREAALCGLVMIVYRIHSYIFISKVVS